MANGADPPILPAGGSSLPAKIPITLKSNGVVRKLEVAAWTTLLNVLREKLELTGAKKGCDYGQHGACTVLVNGRRIDA